MAQVSIIILNWNGRRYLETCLPAVLAQTYDDFKVVLVDNGSDDGSVELVQTQFPSVRLIQNTQNRGFAAANNQAIRATTSEFVATLNNDARPEPDWVATLVTAMAARPRVGMCASKMLFADRPDVINSAGLAVDRAGIAWDRCGGQSNDPPSVECEEIVPVFGPCAGAALYRRTMLDQVGLFDETFFAYLEDVDLAWRAQMSGWEAAYVPQARVYHHHSATAGARSAFKRRLLGRNKIWLIVKNYPTPALLRYLPAILVYDWIAVGYTLLIQRDLSALQGRLEGLRRLPHVLRQRRRVQALRTRTSAETVQRLEPLVPPWRVWRRFAHLEHPSSQNGMP